jgi:DNA-binding FadR family transcriptional regulator
MRNVRRLENKPSKPGQNLTASIVQALGRAIVTGKFSRENPFPVEARLCTEYGASRTALREAVKMLTAKGLLGARPRHGTWVEPEEKWNLFDPDVMRWLLERKFSYTLLIEFTQMRLAVEPAAAAMAAQASPEAKAAIGRALNRMIAAQYGEDDPLVSDIAFHSAILRGSGNRFYAQLRELSETALRFSIRTTNSYKGVTLASIGDHKKVYDAIAAGDAMGAEKAMRFLIEEAGEFIRAAQIADRKKKKQRISTGKARTRRK